MYIDFLNIYRVAVFLCFSDKLSHFKRKHNPLRISHACIDWSILHTAHCGQGEEEVGYNHFEPIFLCLVSIARYVPIPLETLLCLWLGENPFLQIREEALCHAMSYSPFNVLSLMEILHSVHLLHLFLHIFLLHLYFKCQFGPSHSGAGSEIISGFP